MVKGLYTAHTGMVNEMKRMDVLANNLANSDTYGFKKEGTTSHSFKNELAIKIKDTSNYGLHKNLGSRHTECISVRRIPTGMRAALR